MAMKIPQVPKSSYGEIRQGRAEGAIPLSFTIHNMFPVNDWRIAAFTMAVESVLTHPISKEEAHSLRMGCIKAAHSSNRVELDESIKVFSPEVQKVCDLLGEKDFKALYDAAPPTEVIDYMINGEYRASLDFWPDTPEAEEVFKKERLDEITCQVINGHMEWEDRFTEAGVPTPAEYMDKLTAQAEEQKARLRELGLVAIS